MSQCHIASLHATGYKRLPVSICICIICTSIGPCSFTRYLCSKSSVHCLPAKHDCVFSSYKSVHYHAYKRLCVYGKGQSSSTGMDPTISFSGGCRASIEDIQLVDENQSESLISDPVWVVQNLWARVGCWLKPNVEVATNFCVLVS